MPGRRETVRRVRGDAGLAMAEFVLTMPIIALVLMLIFTFGQVFLERQRTMVAVREVGIRHAASIPASPDGGFQTHADAVEAQILAPRGMSAQITERPDGSCPRHGEAADYSEVHDDLFQDILAPILSKISAGRSYEIHADGRRLFNPLGRDTVYENCFAIDGNPWTKEETGTPLDWIKKALGGLAKEIADVFF